MPWNEISRRYVDDEPEFYVPDVWRGRSEDKKQGSSDTVITELVISDIECPITGEMEEEVFDIKEANEINYNGNLNLYKDMLAAGVAPEQARMILPQSMMTEWYWSGTLFSFSKMCGLRLKEDTQAETRVVAEQIDVVMQKIYPVSWEALKEYAQ
jgi:thymidylate synthase (FAD)